MSNQLETKDDIPLAEEDASEPLDLRQKLRRTSSIIMRESWDAFKLTLVLLLLCGILFPLLVFIPGQSGFHDQANGSLIMDKQGQVIGSKLLGQQFTTPEYFHGRPSITGYDASNSSGSNLGPTNPQLITGNGSQITVVPGAPVPPDATPVAGKPHIYNIPGSYLGVKTYAEQFRQENGLAPGQPLPADIITASGSGLDPDISVEAALLQVNRVVAARKLLGGTNAAITVSRVRALIAQKIEGRQLGVLGEPRVNVLQLNLALNGIYGVPHARK